MLGWLTETHSPSGQHYQAVPQDNLLANLRAAGTFSAHAQLLPYWLVG